MTHRFQINLRGIIELLSNHLYSRPEVFVRELLQNGVDAITARQQIEPNHQGEIVLSITSPRGKPPTLEMSDNGIGLTEDEVHRFLATIGETSKRNAEGERTGDFLGQFGIGLLSCFVVSNEIVVVTKSVKEGAQAVEWRGKTDGTYSVRTLDMDISPGTKVYLTCLPGREEFYASEALRDLVRYYGLLLPFPIRVSTSRNTTIVNAKGAPWRQKYSSEKVRTQEYLRFGKDNFESPFLDAIPIKSEIGGVEGIAFVLPQPANLNSKRSHRVYLRNMLLSEEAENLLPDWAFFVKAIVNVEHLRPTASRESFYEDDRLEETRTELGNCLRDYLMKIAEQESNRFERFLDVHHLALKSLAAQDEQCYQMFIDWLPFETSHGRMTAKELSEQKGTIYFVDEVPAFYQNEKIASAQGFLLVNGGYVYDRDLLNRLSEVYPEIQIEQLDPSSLLNQFDELDMEDQDRVHDLLVAASEALRPFHCGPEVRKFQPPDLPTLFSAGQDSKFLRSIETSKEKADPLFQGILSSLETRVATPKTTLVFNFLNPMIQKLCQVKDRNILGKASQLLYVQSLLLAHQPLNSREMGLLTEGLSGLLESVLEKNKVYE